MSTLLSHVHDYYAQKPDFSQHIGTDSDPVLKENESTTGKKTEQEDYLVNRTKGIKLNDRDHEAFVRNLYRIGGPDQLSTPDHIEEDNMPVHPAEENATGNITDQVAKESKDSTASSHPAHQEDTGATSGGSLHAQAHKANPGPVVVDGKDIGTPESKADLKKKAAELNK